MSEKSDEDESDTFGSDSDDDDDEYVEKLKKEAGKLKQKRMAARPSTIVQVSTGPLELHLQSMKKQLKEHTALINHPPFLDELMIEVNKISGLIRKIEHCQLDINTVRETIVATTGSSSMPTVKDTSGNISMTDKLNQLYKDLEMLRAVIRRIDVHQAVDAKVLSKVSALAKSLKKLKEYSEKMYTNNMRVIQDELKGEIKSVNARIQQMDDLQIEKLNEVFERIQKTEDNIHDGQKEETERIAKKVEYIEDHLTTDFYSFKKEMDSQLALTKETARRAYIQVSKDNLETGIQKISYTIQNNFLNSMRRRFIKWRNFDPLGDLSRGRRLISLTKRAHKKMLTRSALFEWKCYHEKQKERERMKQYMTGIIHKWKDLVFPALAKGFHTWKRYCVFLRFHMVERKALESIQNVTENVRTSDSEIYNNEEYDQLITTLNPVSDIQGSFQLTGLYVDRIYNKINKLNDGLKQGDYATRSLGQRMEGMKNSLVDKFEERCDQLDNHHKTHTKQMHARIREINSTHIALDEKTDKSFNATKSEIRRLDSSVADLSFKIDEQSCRLERLFALHQKMIDRIDAIEITQKSHDSRLDQINSKLTNLSEKTVRNDDEMMRLKSTTEMSMRTIKEQIDDVHHASNDCSLKMQAVLSNQSQGHSEVANLTKDFKNKVSSIESWLNTTAPKPPSPKLLVSLALKFEDRAVEKHCKDPAHMFSVSMSTELAKDIATCAHWLVYHIIEATDVDVLTRIMKGPQDVATVYDQTDPSNSLHREPEGNKNYNKASHLTHEEFCATTRESMLLRYIEKFQKQLNQSRDEVGIIRKEARALFIKRFIDSLDLSLQKHDVIVLNTASAMGRNPSHVSGRPHNEGGAPPACVACDRPLRMRTTTRTIGELYEKIQMSGKKSSDIKREVLRNQIVIPQNRPTSPHHNYRFESDTSKSPGKTKPNYPSDNFESRLSMNNNNNNQNDYNYNTNADDFREAHVDDRPGGQSVIRIRPVSSSRRPQSASRDHHMMNSHSAAQLSTYADHAAKKIVASPSKGGGFKTSKSSSQENMMVDIANELPIDSSIPLRHSIDHLPTTTRKLVGKFEGTDGHDDENNHNNDNSNARSHNNSQFQSLENCDSAKGRSETEGVPTGKHSVDLMKVYSSPQKGLRGSFAKSGAGDDAMSDGTY